MKKINRKFSLSRDTLRTLDPQELERAAGDSLVTTTSQLPNCHTVLPPC